MCSGTRRGITKERRSLESETEIAGLTEDKQYTTMYHPPAYESVSVVVVKVFPSRVHARILCSRSLSLFSFSRLK